MTTDSVLTTSRWTATLAAGALLATLVGVSGTPARADATTPAAAESRAGSSSPLDVPDLALAPAGEAIVTDRRDAEVAPGVDLTSFERLDARGWLRGDVLVTDLQGGSVVDQLNPGTVSGREVLSQQGERKDAVAGVNGDFFDINDTGAPLGVGIERSGDEGRLRHAPASGHNESAVIGTDGLGAIAQVLLEGTASDGTDSLTLTNLNSPTVAAGGVGLFTPEWGAAGRDRTVDGVALVHEVVVDDGVVLTSTDEVSATPLTDGQLALVARDDAAAQLAAAFEPGERVEVDYGARSDAGELAVAVSGNVQLARDGVVLPVDDVALHPRTAVGFSADGRTMWLVTVDGRSAASRGLTERELGRLLVDLGADDVLNLDGGGSSTMLAREPGSAAPEVVNSPSDGSERLTPNGLGVLAPDGSGLLTGFHVEPATADDPDAGSDSDDLRVLTGLTRVVRAAGHDETQAPVEASPRWSTRPGRQARVVAGDVPGTAVVTGRTVGTATVRASASTPQGVVAGTVELQVLGEPVRLTSSVPRVSLDAVGATGAFQVRGADAGGWSTWVEPGDVELSVEGDGFEVAPVGDGYAVTATADSGSGLVTARVGSLTTVVAVTVGLTPVVVDPMDDASRWTAAAAPATTTAAVSSAPGREGGSAVALDYSLTGSTATRAAYVTASPQQVLPGAPQRIGAWVNGDGQGAWLRANVYDAAGGAAKTVDLAATVDWTGWRWVEATVPAGLVAPLTFWRLYVVETVPSRQYAGRIVVDDLTVFDAPAVEVPAAPRVTDPVAVTDGVVSGADRWRYAVLSDVQFTADDPDGDLVAAARRTIREALAAEPEFLVINGDFVDRALPQDLELARRIIDEEVGGRVPVHYVPGNHETYGPGDLSSWEAVFGPASQTFDHRGTRFVLLDTSLGTIRAGGFDQVLMLQDALAGAATDPAVENVVVMGHHPVDDPLPTDNSQLADRLEAELLVDWLSDLRAGTGKGAAYVASHAGVFTASRQDGVLLPLLGNAGKGPTTGPADGGYTGWALVGLENDPQPADPGLVGRPSDRSDAWLRVELRPHVDELTLTVPSSLAVGETGSATAVVGQDGRQVPVAWPVAADWHGAGVHVGAAADAGPRAVAAFDPPTGALVALRPGTAELGVTVNGVTRTASLRVG